MASKREIGLWGETFAAQKLEEQGYAVLRRNVSSRYGEVDIIATDGEYICFVEVKTRRSGAMVSGAYAVGMSKQRKIIQTALLFLQENPLYNDMQPRFDVFCAETCKGEIVSYDLLKGAFDGEAYG